ncbi:MAG: ion transporter [Bdellovibrionales bacterium]|nr:ion transporter [Bdellovibrionales bacterium]
MTHSDNKPETPGLRRLMHEVIFEAETPSGKLFDVLLLWAIVLSVGAVALESVAEIRAEYGKLLYATEWFFTVVFTVEYVSRVYCSDSPRRYVLSFFGIIDLLAVIPTYLSFFVLGSQYLTVVRVIRLLRVFRVLKMTRYLGEAEVLMEALRASKPKITVFLGSVLSVVVVIGSLMHIIEGPEHGFSNIPVSMYWAIVTLTTVGYGDIAPGTVLGRTLAAAVMILGYGVIAVPTGIVSVELHKAAERMPSKSRCRSCGVDGHRAHAVWCYNCGSRLTKDSNE